MTADNMRQWRSMLKSGVAKSWLCKSGVTIYCLNKTEQARTRYETKTNGT